MFIALSLAKEIEPSVSYIHNPIGIVISTFSNLFRSAEASLRDFCNLRHNIIRLVRSFNHSISASDHSYGRSRISMARNPDICEYLLMGTPICDLTPKLLVSS